MPTSTRRFLLITLALFALTVPAFAKFQVRPGWVKAYVNTASAPELANLVAGANAELLWVSTTEAKAVVYAPSLPSLTSVATTMGLRVIAAKDISDLANVGGLVFDPRTVEPRADDIREYRSSDPGLYVLMFAVNPDPGYIPQLAALGMTVVAEAGGNTAVVMAKPGDALKADALPWVAYRNFLQPWMKGDHLADPERYYNVRVTVAPGAPNRDRIARDFALPAFAFGPTGSCYLGADLAPMFSHPLVLSVRVLPSIVDVSGVLPGQAPAGSVITVNTRTPAYIDTLRVGGVAATFTRLDSTRLRVTVPHGLPPGPADILALRNDGWRQALPARAGFGLHIADTYGRTIFARGDLIVLTEFPAQVLLPSPLYDAQWVTPQGELRRALDDGFGPLLLFGAQGFLNMTAVGGVPRRFDAHFEASGAAPAVLDDAVAAVIARDGTSFVVVGNELRRHSPGGTLEAKAPLTGARSVDVDVDQCTLVLATADGLKLYDGCRMAALSTLRSGDWIAARFLRDGSILGSSRGDTAVYRLSRSGGILAKTTLDSAAIALSTDSSFAWLGSGADVYRFDLTTNQRTPAFTVRESIRGLAVYGEWTAARGEATYDDEIVIESVTGFDGIPGTPVTITGRAFLPGASVTVGGLAVAAPNVGETKITFTMPSGAKTTREVVVTNPNGERGTFAARQGKRRAV